MSITEEQVQEAAAHMMDNVTVPAFFTKLASHGIVPNTQEEEGYLWSIGVALLEREMMQRQKQASANSNTLRALAEELTGRPAASPYDSHAAALQQHVINDASLLKAAALLVGVA